MYSRITNAISRIELWRVLLLICVPLLAVLGGAISALGQPVFVGAFLALFVGTAILFRPAWLLWLVLFGGLVVAGLTELYFPFMRQIRWIVAIGAISLCLIALLHLVGKSGIASSLRAEPVPFSSYAGLFFLVAAASAVINNGFSFETAIGLKGYFQVWGIMLALYWCRFSTETVDRYFKALVPLAFLQVPFALHQYFVLVPQRMSQEAANKLVVAPDIVVGTFVGSMEGGGGSAVLAVLQVSVIAIVLSLWRKEVISTARVLLISLICIIPLVLNETKITFVFLLIAVALVFRQELLRRPGRVIGVAVVVAGFLAALLVVYSMLPRAQSQSNATLSDYIERTVSYNFGEVGYGASMLNRTSVYSFWARHQSLSDPVGFVIGHGPGSTNEGGAGLMQHSLAKDKYPGVGIGLTGLSSLLWEVGVLGTVFVLMILWSAFWEAGRLAVSTHLDIRHQAIFSGLQVSVALVALSLLHNNFFVFEIGFQTFAMLILGYIAFWRSRLPANASAKR